MKLILAIAAVAILFLCPRPALACSCGGTTSVCDAFQSAQAVFVGSVTRVANEVIKNKDDDSSYPRQTAYVQVEEAFKGANQAEFILRSRGSSCEADYKEGERWLIYAYYNKEEKTWSSTACGRSTLIEGAAGDLLYLRGLPESAQKTRIAGQLWANDSKPLLGIKVKVTGEGETREVFTDKNGVYEIYSLPPGEYLIQPDVPLNLKLALSSISIIDDNLHRERVKLKEKSCVNVNFHFVENTLISGRVFSPEGEPMPGVCVRLFFKQKPEETPYLVDCTDDDGRFTIDEIRLGEYFLVANDDGEISSEESFPLTYYPGVFAKEKAIPLTIASGDQLKDFDIHIPAIRRTRSVAGRVFFSDGRPAAGMFVAFVPENVNADLDGTADARADGEGRFRFRVLEGLRGVVRGYMYTYSGEFENCPKVEALLNTRKDIVTNSVNVELNRDYEDVEVVFPFPHCTKAKQ